MIGAHNCRNKLIIHGCRDGMLRFQKNFRGDNSFSLDWHVPSLKELREQNWGVKEDLFNVKYVSISDGKFETSFYTKNSHPHMWLKNCVKIYPELLFKLHFLNNRGYYGYMIDNHEQIYGADSVCDFFRRPQIRI
jgi:hypothetical protein